MRCASAVRCLLDGLELCATCVHASNPNTRLESHAPHARYSSSRYASPCGLCIQSLLLQAARVARGRVLYHANIAWVMKTAHKKGLFRVHIGDAGDICSVERAKLAPPQPGVRRTHLPSPLLHCMCKPWLCSRASRPPQSSSSFPRALVYMQRWLRVKALLCQSEDAQPSVCFACGCTSNPVSYADVSKCGALIRRQSRTQSFRKATGRLPRLERWK